MRDINFDISGQVAVITGAGGIICGVMAREMAKKGAKVALLDITVDRVQALADKLGNLSAQNATLFQSIFDAILSMTWHF